MKVCIYLENYIAGGVDTVLVNILNHWPDGDDLTLVCNRSHEGLEKIIKKKSRRPYQLIISPVKTIDELYGRYLPKLKIFQFPLKLILFYGRYLLFIYNVKKLKTLFRQLAPEAVFVHNGGYPGASSSAAAIISASKAGIRNIFLIIHNLAKDLRISHLPFEIALDRIADVHSKKIICVSNKAKEVLLSKRIIKQNIYVIYNGIEDTGNLSEDEIEEFRKTYGLSEASKIISMVGSYEERKGHEDLFIALEILKKKSGLENCHCLIFGNGSPSEEKRIKQAIVKHGIEDIVTLCGFRSNISRLFKLFNIHIVASKKFESSPITILEAMAAGIPVVATDIGGVSEIIVDKITGFVIQPNKPEILAEKINLLLNNQELRDEMGREARKRFESSFTVEQMIQKYYELIH